MALGALLVLLLFGFASFLVSLGGASASASCAPAATSDLVLAGAAKADISPRQSLYLSGYGFGPARRSTGILQPLYARALALRGLDGQPTNTVVFVALDSQGYFAAYQAGPYGSDAIRAAVAARLGIPAPNVIIAATHSHAAPDTIGFWGGVPASYLAEVRDQTISAITQAVTALTPATLSAGNADLTGDTRSFGDWPVDARLRTLRVTASPTGRTLATLLNISVHPTTLGATNTLVAPDWPGVTATAVERALGGTALVMPGALGHTWPALPPGTPPPTNQILFMQQYGQLLALRALAAVGAAQPVRAPTLCVADRRFREADTTAPLLLGLQLVGRSDHERLLRSLGQPAYVPPIALGVEVETIRVGNLVFFAAPVELYPSLLETLRQRVQAPQAFFFGLANDQLGYATPAGEYLRAVRASPTDEALFIINPTFGDAIVDQLTAGARQVGFLVNEQN
ncbi:MAG: neutral/alkaline non-lysosomal ceramidase N-terminal domain-containing protein [Ktedonobacterales bacterium]|nr:neutral/alkaline non-lysosomal ceramidase N-terminal domain-containing protein [Ktedonobacterales bacterium]